MSPTFRQAIESDLDSLCAIEGTGWSRSQFSSELEKGLFVEKSLKGFAALRIVVDEARLYMIGVDGPSRRSGIGRGLLDECFRRAKKAGCRQITLEVSANNAAGIGLYESRGFRVVGRRTKYYNDGADALLMDASL